MWNVSMRTITGAYHERNKMLCQDQVFCKKGVNGQSVVLADGTGDSNANTFCVREVADFTSDALLEFAESGFDGPIGKEDVIQRLMEGIVRIISKYMESCQLPADAFASTLMGIAIDHRRGNYLLIHLGDGIILGRSGQQSCVLSYPVNGNADQTFLTISENLFLHMKVRQGRLEKLDRLVLCSDGVYNLPLGRTFTDQTIWRLLDGEEEFRAKEDDQSYIEMRRSGYGNFCRHSRRENKGDAEDTEEDRGRGTDA